MRIRSILSMLCTRAVGAGTPVAVALGLVFLTPVITVAADPYVDTGFTPTTARPDPDLVIVREQFYGAGGVDLTAYGMGSGNTYVQSIYFRLFVDNDAPSIDSFTGLVVFPEEITILGFIVDGTQLGGEIDDGLFTNSDLTFGIGGDPDAYSEAARGFEAGGGTSHSEFIGQLSDHAFTFGQNVTDGVDDFRVIIGYGGSFGTELSFDLLAFDVGTLGGAVPTIGIRIGDDSNPVVFGSGDFGEIPSLLNIPLTSTTPPTPGDVIPFEPLASLFIMRDRGATSAADGYDTNYDVPLPDLFPVTTHVAAPVGITDGNDGLLYGVGQDGGLAVINPVARTVDPTLVEDRSGSSVAVTNLPGNSSLFIARDTSGDTMVDVLDPVSRTLGASFPVPAATSPVDIADGPDGQLYILGLGGGLASVAPDGTGASALQLNPPDGNYAGLTSRAGSRLLYLVRDTAGDTKVDTFNVDTDQFGFDFSVFPSPGTPIGITDGPDDHLYVVGEGLNGPAAYAEIDPNNGAVVLTHAFMDFVGENVALTNLEVLTVVAVRDGPVSRGGIVHRAVPNPFNPSTRIEFILPLAGEVSVSIYDVSGRLVRTLANRDRFAAGPHALAWHGRTQTGRPVSSGTYFYRIESRDGVATGKLSLIK